MPMPTIVTGSTAPYAHWSNWPSTIDATSAFEVNSTGLFHGRLHMFHEVREQSACGWSHSSGTLSAAGTADSTPTEECMQVVFGDVRFMNQFALADVRKWYGHSYGTDRSYLEVPPCTTSYGCVVMWGRDYHCRFDRAIGVNNVINHRNHHAYQ